MARTPQEIFAHHAEALIAGDLDCIVADYADNVLFIEWNAVSAETRAMDGIDTFVFEGDSIRVQTVRYTLEKTG
jgi:hypothetical protein